MRREDIVWTYSAVRPLYDDGASKAQEATRDYVLKEDVPVGAAPRIDVFGGKITTYRRLAEQMLEKIEHHLGVRGKPWTAHAPLPGGDFAPDGYEREVASLRQEFVFIDPAHAARLVRLYGTRARKILEGARSYDQLGRHFGADLYQAEIDFLIDEEWATTAQDVLWRRTKRGLRLTAEEASMLDQYMAGVARERSSAAE